MKTRLLLEISLNEQKFVIKFKKDEVNELVVVIRIPQVNEVNTFRETVSTGFYD